jgi:hypothetical protein
MRKRWNGSEGSLLLVRWTKSIVLSKCTLISCSSRHEQKRGKERRTPKEKEGYKKRGDDTRMAVMNYSSKGLLFRLEGRENISPVGS